MFIRRIKKRIINWLLKGICIVVELIIRLFLKEIFWDYLFRNEFYVSTVGSNANLRDKFLSDAEFFLKNDNKNLKTILSHDLISIEAKYILLSDSLTYMNFARDKISGLNYNLPTYLISYPRSGSNFLQSVLEASCGLYCRSIYASNNMKPQYILSLKSHSPSYAYLIDEIKRWVPESSPPEKFIFLYRDPRDVMISFYEFLQATKNVKVDQTDFLEGVSYFYATFKDKDKTLSRKIEYSPSSVIDMYKKHIKNWFVKPPDNVELLKVKYEDLVYKTYEEFNRIFQFLNIDCPLASAKLNHKVSQYYKSPRKRGKAGGWKSCRNEYGELISQTNKLLKNEIEILGY